MNLNVIYSENGKTMLESIPNNDLTRKLLEISGAVRLNKYFAELKEFYKTLIEGNEI